ncbi:hypothetical protein GO599_03565 [Sulfolobus islandicus]|nr:hypothetical protein GO599_03565 [Sulfolobus islandicus]
MDQRIPDRRREMPILKVEKRNKQENQRKGDKPTRTTRQYHMGNINIEEKFHWYFLI